MATEKAERHKFPAADLTPAQLVKSGDRKLAQRYLNVLILFGKWRKVLRSGRGRSCYRSVGTVIKRTVVIIETLIFPTTYKFYATFYCQGYLHVQRKLMMLISMEFEATFAY
jgi:hypothetical protein